MVRAKNLYLHAESAALEYTEGDSHRWQHVDDIRSAIGDPRMETNIKGYQTFTSAHMQGLDRLERVVRWRQVGCQHDLFPVRVVPNVWPCIPEHL